MTTLDRYAVFGNPVAHSKSPEIHALFAQQTGEQLVYTKQQVELEQFAEQARLFFANGGKGLNITLPFKQAAAAFVQSLSARAQRANAVNTIVLQSDGALMGDNTDGIGLLRDVTINHGWVIRGKRVLLLGAGGAVRGVLANLLAELPACVTIANRTPEKAHDIAQEFAGDVPMTGVSYAELVNNQFDVVINGTSASIAGDLPPLPATLLAVDACCYDMMYGAAPTVFMQWCVAHRAACVADGLGMLVEQAAESFYLWRGVRPETTTVIAALRQSLSLRI